MDPRINQTADAAGLRAGDTVSHYQIIDLAGTGGMGNVYKARDNRLERFVALKFPRQAFSGRVMREARLIASVSHRSICRLLDLGETGGASFLVLEYVEGQTLAKGLQHGAVPTAQAIDLALEVLSAVAAIHGRGLVHGDLKPANIMLTPDGPRILDFGLATLLHSAVSEHAAGTGSTPSGRGYYGTPGYIAPELLNGSAPTMLSDLFALGAVFYEAISGAPAFPGSGVLARLAATAQDSPPPLSGSGQLTALECVLRRAMAKTPAARFASAAEFADELREAAKLRTPAPTTAPAVVLVLPFRNEQNDAAAEFLAQTLPDAITSELASSPNLQVRSTMLGKRYGSSPPDLRAVAAETAANLMVTGTIFRCGEEIALSTQLLQIPEGAVVSAGNHRSPISDWFMLQNEAVRHIMRAIELRFGLALSPPAITPPLQAAYDVYLRANFAAQNPRRIAEACEMYELSLKLDPGYAPAWARLGRCYRLVAKYLGQPSRNMKLGREALERAVSLNPDLHLAQSYYAQHQADEGRSIDALIGLLRLARSAPLSAEVLAGLTYVCRLCGLYDESIRFHKAARKLDPTTATSVTHTFFQVGQYVQCLETYSGQGIGYIEPLALHGLGMHEEAVARIAENLSAAPAATVGALYVRSLHALWSGDLMQAWREIETAGQSYFLGPEEHYYFARKRIFGNMEGGMGQLAHAVRNGFYGHRTLLHDPWLASVRHDREFKQILTECALGNRRATEAFQQNQLPNLW